MFGCVHEHQLPRIQMSTLSEGAEMLKVIQITDTEIALMLEVLGQLPDEYFGADGFELGLGKD